MVPLVYAALSFASFFLFYAFALSRVGESIFDVARETDSGRSLASRFDDDDKRSGKKSSGGDSAPLTREQAFELLFSEKTFDSVCRWLGKLKIDPWEREDLAQDVLLSAFQSFPTYDPQRARPEGWLYTITVRKVYQFWDRVRHQREHRTTSAFPDVTEEGLGADDQIHAEERRLLVLDLLDEVDADLRMVLIAHDIEGIPMPAIAAQRRISVSTAYKLRARAMAALQRVATKRSKRERR